MWLHGFNMKMSKTVHIFRAECYPYCKKTKHEERPWKIAGKPSWETSATAPAEILKRNSKRNPWKKDFERKSQIQKTLRCIPGEKPEGTCYLREVPGEISRAISGETSREIPQEPLTNITELLPKSWVKLWKKTHGNYRKNFGRNPGKNSRRKFVKKFSRSP